MSEDRQTGISREVIASIGDNLDLGGDEELERQNPTTLSSPVTVPLRTRPEEAENDPTLESPSTIIPNTTPDKKQEDEAKAGESRAANPTTKVPEYGRMLYDTLQALVEAHGSMIRIQEQVIAAQQQMLNTQVQMASSQKALANALGQRLREIKDVMEGRTPRR